MPKPATRLSAGTPGLRLEPSGCRTKRAGTDDGEYDWAKTARRGTQRRDDRTDYHFHFFVLRSSMTGHCASLAAADCAADTRVRSHSWR